METLDLFILLTALVGLLAIAAGMVRMTRGSAAAAAADEGAADQAVQDVGRGGHAQEAAPGLRRRGREHGADPEEQEANGAGNAGAAGAEDQADGDEEPEIDEENMRDANGNPLSKRDLKKLLKKKEKRDQKRAEREARQYKEERLSKREEAYRKKIEEREAARLAREEAERKEQEEKEQKEKEVYDEWSKMFEVEQEGTGEAEMEGEAQDKLNDFISFIERNKVVVLEELAHEFGLRIQDAISRVEDLQASGRLQGVTDDRGKFIYVSDEEMDSMADFLRSRGRVSITELARESSRLVRLKGEHADAVLADEDVIQEEENGEGESGGSTAA